MPAAAFHFEVLSGAIAALNAAGDPKGRLIEDNDPYAYLGAMGPDLFKYTFIDDPDLLRTLEAVLSGTIDPSDLDPLDQLGIHRNLLMVAYGQVYARFVDLWPLLEDLHALLDQLQVLADAEDQDALKDMQDEIDAIQGQLGPLTGAADAGSDAYDAIVPLVRMYRPMIQADSATANALQTRPLTWRLSEFLRWRGTGRLARKLFELAGNEDDPVQRDRKLAFAYGWMTHLATSVTAEPMVDNIVGGPYRTHWWRHRLIQNYVDTWTWGRYRSGAVMAGDTPTPDYDEWQDICRSALHERIRMEGSPDGNAAIQAVVDGLAPDGALPAFVSDMLAEAIEETYQGELLQPLPPGSFSPARINNAFVGALSVLYFMTGGQPPMCTQHPGTPPSDCVVPPDWVTSGGGPPATESDDFVDSSEKATKIILAILAILAFLGGAFAAGIAALAAAAAIDPVKWSDLRCHIYWLRFYLFQQEKGLRDALVLGTLAYPAPEDLATAATDGPPDGPARATHYCRTRNDREQSYPRRMTVDEATLFTSYPPPSIELPDTRSWPRAGDYPSVALDDPTFTSVAGDITDNDPANFPTKLHAGAPAWFGNAVLNAVAVIQRDAQGLVDYNLDGDRGYGWLAWSHPPGSFPSDPPIDAEPA